jgi:hypothetical protein
MKRRSTVLALAWVALATQVVVHASLAAEHSTGKLAAYTIIAVEGFTVDKNAATEDFPKGLETMLQGRVVQELRKKGMFQEVLDVSEPGKDRTLAASARTDSTGAAVAAVRADSTAAVPKRESAAEAGADSAAENGRRVVMGNSILIFDKGSRAGRYFGGFGAGQTKIKARFVFTDPQTGKEVLRFDQQGTFKGAFSTFGGSEDEAFTGAARGLVKAMLNELEKNL